MEERRMLFRDGLQISSVLNCPDMAPVRRVVLGVHGFGGSTRDAIQAGLAEEMGMFGAAMLRFDFPCHGESPVEELTLTGCADTLLAVAREAKDRFPQAEDLCIFATGFGAYVTLVCLDRLLELPGRIRLVIQTPSVRMHESVLRMLRISRETLRTMGRATLAAPKPFDITDDFCEQLEQNSVMIEYPIPMLILQGEEDDYIRMEDIQNFHRLNEDSKLVIIPGTSHQFLEEGAWDMVLDLTRDWFAHEQVLLSDWE